MKKSTLDKSTLSNILFSIKEQSLLFFKKSVSSSSELDSPSHLVISSLITQKNIVVLISGQLSGFSCLNKSCLNKFFTTRNSNLLGTSL
jgi:hypothetical protein